MGRYLLCSVCFQRKSVYTISSVILYGKVFVLYTQQPSIFKHLWVKSQKPAKTYSKSVGLTLSTMLLHLPSSMFFLRKSVYTISSVIRYGKVFVFHTTTLYFHAFVSKVWKTGKNVLKVSQTDIEHPIFSIILSQRCFFEKGL